jgi:hypothetical protein
MGRDVGWGIGVIDLGRHDQRGHGYTTADATLIDAEKLFDNRSHPLSKDKR